MKTTKNITIDTSIGKLLYDGIERHSWLTKTVQFISSPSTFPPPLPYLYLARGKVETRDNLLSIFFLY